MLRFRLPLLTFLSPLLILLSYSHPLTTPPEGLKLLGRTGTFSDLSVLFQGNQEFRDTVDPALLKDLAENGQHPPYLFLGCSDSRVSEGTIFNAEPGTLFAERNIANQYSALDSNVRAIMAYGSEELKVQHILIVGHYGCGGVAASIATPPQVPWDDATAAIQEWIVPIRVLYQNSTRAEVVSLRKQNSRKSTVPAPGLHDPGFRALVEENVKNSVQKVASDKIITESYHNGHIFYIHGLVYDIENGEVLDLGVSVGPPGHPVPPSPFASVAAGSVDAN